jgi:hypothetical protein
MLGAILVWQFLIVTLQLCYKIKGTGLATLAILFVLLIACRSTLGGTALYLCGFGGGIPISLLANEADLKSAGPEHRFHSQRIDGCLVLWVGTQISIQRPTNDKDKLGPCRLNPHMKNKLYRLSKTKNELEVITVPTTVDTINRSDVLTIFSVGRWR